MFKKYLLLLLVANNNEAKKWYHHKYVKCAQEIALCALIGIVIVVGVAERLEMRRDGKDSDVRRRSERDTSTVDWLASLSPYKSSKR